MLGMREHHRARYHRTTMSTPWLAEATLYLDAEAALGYVQQVGRVLTPRRTQVRAQRCTLCRRSIAFRPIAFWCMACRWAALLHPPSASTTKASRRACDRRVLRTFCQSVWPSRSACLLPHFATTVPTVLVLAGVPVSRYVSDTIPRPQVTLDQTFASIHEVRIYYFPWLAVRRCARAARCILARSFAGVSACRALVVRPAHSAAVAQERSCRFIPRAAAPFLARHPALARLAPHLMLVRWALRTLIVLKPCLLRLTASLLVRMLFKTGVHDGCAKQDRLDNVRKAKAIRGDYFVFFSGESPARGRRTHSRCLAPTRPSDHPAGVCGSEHDEMMPSYFSQSLIEARSSPSAPSAPSSSTCGACGVPARACRALGRLRCAPASLFRVAGTGRRACKIWPEPASSEYRAGIAPSSPMCRSWPRSTTSTWCRSGSFHRPTNPPPAPQSALPFPSPFPPLSLPVPAVALRRRRRGRGCICRDVQAQRGQTKPAGAYRSQPKALWAAYRWARMG